MNNPNGPAPFGTTLGYAPGNVPVYSSDYDSADDSEFPDRHSYRSYLDGIYLGHKWQCVEFCRRWLYLNRGYVFDDVAMAYEIFQLAHVRETGTDKKLPLHSFANGSKRLPEPGCMLVWNEGGEFSRTGHVAIVTEVLPDRLRIAEQNLGHRLWPEGHTYSRELEARTTDDGHYWLRCSMNNASILGWVIQTEDSHYAETRKVFNKRLLALSIRHIMGKLDSERAWLNEANPAEAAYVEMMGGHLLSNRPEDQDRYVCMSHAAEERLKNISNEMHSLFLHATDYVLQDESRLEKFNIPASIWPRIKQSWDNRRNQMITGRLDFAVTPNGIKVYEYNSDSASCHMETAVVQGKWARYAGCDVGWDPGSLMYDRLVQAWRQSDAEGLVHILHDDDPEERYHALFMQEIMEAAGLQCKVLASLQGLRWADDGNMLDADGEAINWVWKTWAWETALDQIRKECEEDDARLREYEPGRRKDYAPRLVDVLLRKNVMVYEPLWTLIPSNKAILPILWELFPNHPVLLQSSYELDESLEATGYVIKPIVGRCGSNITLVGKDNTVLQETDGSFDRSNQMYQELYPLPKIDNLNIQISTFTVNGSYAGSCTRTDYSGVIRADSDMIALRVVPDYDI